MSPKRTGGQRPSEPETRARLGWVLGAACLLSGAAALLYQVLWARQLALVLGSTVAAVSTVLATFMGGLGLGSALAGRYVDRLPPAALPRTYAALEGGIAAGAFLLSWLLSSSASWLAGFSGAGLGPAGLLLARAVTCVALLIVPTALMGATLPTLVALSRAGSAGRRAGSLYALNSLGAVAGSLGAALVLLPSLGVWRSNLLAMSLNAVAGLGVMALSRPSPPATAAERPPKGGKQGSPPAPAETLGAPWVLAVIALSGLAALAEEVAWTRALVLLIGPTSYAFAFIVTAVIAGIALGSAAAAPWADRLKRPATLLAGVQLGAALSSLAVAFLIGRLPAAVGELVRQNADRMSRLLLLELLGVQALLAVPCLLFGAAFPLAVGLLSRSDERAGRATGRTYAWNTAGAIAGALLGGFVVLPLLGLEGTLYAAAAVHAVAGTLALVGSGPTLTRLLAGAGVLALCLFARRLNGPWDRELLAGGVYKYASYMKPGTIEDSLREGELVFYREGRTATVAVKELGGTLSLAIDGKVDATSSGDMLTQRLLAHVPLLLHPRPRRVCVIGWGSGVTAGSALTHEIESLEAVEISPEVVEASRLFRHVNRDALADPRLRLVVGDGRNHLLRAERPFDVIISEPSNPWMAGVSALFTRDFFELARARLADGGLFCQWAHIYNMEPGDLQTVVGSFTDAFPEAALFLLNEGDILLVGSAARLPAPEPSVLAGRLAAPRVKADLQDVVVTSPYAFASLFALQTPSLGHWARQAPRHTDDHPVLEFRAPRFLHADTARENHDRLREAARAAPPPEPYASLTAHPTGELLEARGRMLERCGSAGWAFETHREALALAPRHLPAHEGLVRAAVASGQVLAAEETLRGLRDGGAPVQAGIGLALLYNSLGRPAEALQSVQESVRADPGNVRALLVAAEIQSSLGNLEAVEALAGGALRAAPGDPEAEALLAAATLGRGLPKEAAARAEAVLARHPRAPRALEVAAIARAMAGEREAARRLFARLVAAEPNASGHLNNFGVFELEGGDAAAAARLFEQAVDVDPDNPAGYVGLRRAAQALDDGKRLARAERGLERLGVR